MDLNARPDYGVEVAGSTVGYIEIKRPGKKSDPAAFRGHDARQWEKLKLLPNVLYTDGNEWALYRSGERAGPVAHFRSDIRTAGSRLAPSDESFALVMVNFLRWRPLVPRSIGQLVRAVASLCRLLRTEVRTALSLEASGYRTPLFSLLAQDWRNLLFPDSTDDEFADQFAQTVTFALLLSRVEGISFDGEEIGSIAKKLGKKHSVMGKALAVLTDDPDRGLSATLDTLVQVIGAVDWDRIDDGTGSAYLHLYEDFLAVYDPELRKKTGSYYTPDPVVRFMVVFTEEVLRTRLAEREGFASPDVVVVDPAMGTGVYLAHVIERAAAYVAENEGPGAVGPHVRELATRRLIGFERQIGPYAVAEMRLHESLHHHGSEAPDQKLRIYVADTLDDPYVQQTELGTTYAPIAHCRNAANRLKRDEPVMVVIGNPPHDRALKGMGKWVENGNIGLRRTPLDAFRAVGNGRYESVLINMHVFFWRWATWKVFDHHPDAPTGIVAFLCPVAFTTSRGFKGMREYLRHTADEGWIIDLSPEGHQPDGSTRIFPKVQQPLCIAVFARRGRPHPETPAQVHYMSVAGRSAEKLKRLGNLNIGDAGWAICPEEWQGPFRPEDRSDWNLMPLVEDILPWSSRGVTPGRTWVHSPDREVLAHRWRILLAADNERRSELFVERRDRKIHSKALPLPGVPKHHGTMASETGPAAEPVRIGFRSFDRHWLIPDNRLMAVSRPDLWRVRHQRQIYICEPSGKPPSSGPPVTFSADIPDLDYYKGNGGGLVRPLFRDPISAEGNITPGLTAYLAEKLSIPVNVEDIAAYLASIIAHPAYTREFREQLQVPALRLPLSADQTLWEKAVHIGKEVIWLHTYGERCMDIGKARSMNTPQLPESLRPKVEIAIPDTEVDMPESISYDAARSTLQVGKGRIAPVPLEVWAYEVSGMRVIKKWFGYRKKNPSGKRTSPLDGINASAWTPQYTRDLLALLNVLGRLVLLQPLQAQLLAEIREAPQITTADLEKAKVLPVPAGSRKPPKDNGSALFAI
jgi:hypothetical protein